MKFLLAPMLFIVLLFSGTHEASAQQAVRDIEAATLCKSAIKSTNLETINNLGSSDIAKFCNDTPLNRELSMQMLSILVGEPAFYIMNMMQNMGIGWHNAEKGENIFSILSPIHDVFEQFNWLMFKVTFFLFSLVFVVHLFRWARSEEKKGFLKWLNRNFSQNSIALAMSMPVLGWMTPIQIIAVFFIMVIIYATKIVSTIFFAGLFLADTAGALLKDVTPQIEEEMMQTVMIYRCDILRREDLINGLISSNGYTSKAELETDPVFQCLQSGGQTKINPGNALPDVLSYDVTLPVIDNFNQCITTHRSHLDRHKLNPVEDCGYVKLNIPTQNNKQNEIKDRVQSLFLTPQIHTSLRQIAMTIQEYSCRFRKTHDAKTFGSFLASCASMNMQDGGYSLNWVVDPISQQEIIARHLSPLTETAKVQMREQVARSTSSAVNAITENQQELIALLRSLLGSQDDNNQLPSDEKDLDNLVNKMTKGAWMSASVFMGNTASHVDLENIAEIIGILYEASDPGVLDIARKMFTTLDTNWLLIEDLQPLTGQSYFTQKIFTEDRGQYTQSLLMGAILPSFDLYKPQLNCWREQSECDASVLNPFSNLGESGTSILKHAFIGTVTTKALSKFSNQIFKFTGVRTRIMAVSVLADFFMLYMVVGVMLALIIPMYPLLKILSMFTQWSLEIFKELAGLQLSLAFSPISEPGKRVVSNDMRSALARLIALSLYFLFIILGVMVMFLAFSFLFSLNVLLLGGLSMIISFTGGSHFLESVFFGVIFDVLVTILLFLEVKSCTDLIEKVPAALAERFSLELSHGESIGERIMVTFRTHVMPGVNSFMSSIK